MAKLIFEQVESLATLRHLHLSKIKLRLPPSDLEIANHISMTPSNFLQKKLLVTTPPFKEKKPTRYWTLAMFLGFLIAGVLFAVRMGDTPKAEEIQFQELEIGAGKKPVADAGDPPNEAGSIDGADDKLAGRLANMVSEAAIESANHPLEPLLELADEGLKRVDETISDYTATIVSQVRIDDELQPKKQIFCKIRHAKETEIKKTPFSVYLKMLSPDSVAGQEVIWVDGQNKNKLIAHASGMLNVKRVYLEPTGSMAMQGNLHPINNIGFRNLISKMGQVGRRDIQYEDCVVNITRDVTVNGRNCTLVQIKHETKQPHFDFHVVKIYIDQELDVLLGYEGYQWPNKDGEAPVLIEKYFYTDLKINVGLNDEDFSPSNKDYQFPAW